MKHWKLVAVALGTVAAITALGACTSDSGSSGGAAAAYGDAGGASAAPAASASSAAAGTSAGSSVGRASAAAGDADPDIGTSKIRRVDMTVTVKHGVSVAAQADSAETIATSAGGEVDADQRTSGRYASANLVLKVPPDRLADVLTALSKLGTEKSRHRTTVDVTAKVADVTSRVRSARDAITRLRGLYASTTKVADVIAVESELAQRESDLESLEAQQRALSAQTAMATVSLALTTAPAVAKKEHMKPRDDSGFVGGLKSGWHAFATGTSALATAVGAVLPFAVLAIVLLIAARLLWPRLRPAPRPAATSPTE